MSLDLQRYGVRASSAFLAAVLALLLLNGFCPSAFGQQIKRREDAPKPLPPEQSSTRFHLPSDLRIELVASEPLISDPVAVTWDEQGRMFVCELHGYNLEGHLDVVRLNKTGMLDRVVRRIPASPEAKKAAEKQTYGTIKLLVDTDGDGRADRAQVFADRLPPCHGLVAAREGLIVVCRPSILYLADRDGDGRAEVREPLFEGFGITSLERSINNPRWGLDNWIYISGGNAGGQIRGPRLKTAVEIGTTDFRIRADGTAIEPVTGRTATFGLTMNDWGDRFLISTGSPAMYPVPLPYRYLVRNPYVASPPTVLNAANYHRTYPASKPHPWRLERSQQKAWAKYYSDRYGAAEAAPNGFFTSACGQLVYRAATLPQHYRGNLFACEPSQNLVHRCLLQRDGLRFEARRAPSEQKSEFLTSTDQWFRPINLATGPDGAIYIVDMYREIIEDYSAIPRYLQQQYGLIEGNDRGRIWRIVATASSKSTTAEDDETSDTGRRVFPDAMNCEQLVSLLSHPNAWWRQTAQRLLIERRSQCGDVVPSIRKLAGAGKTPQARLHALYALQGLGSLTPAVVQRALGDPHFAVRIHALRLAEPFVNQQSQLRQHILSMSDDPDIKVRLQLALTLGEISDPSASATLARLAARDGDEPWMQAAILSSAAKSTLRLVRALIEQHVEPDRARPLLHALASVIGARRNPNELAILLTMTSEGAVHDVPLPLDTRIDLLGGLVEGLRCGDSRALGSTEGEQALVRLLQSPSAEIRSLALKIVGLVKLGDAPNVREVFAAASRCALDAKRPLEERRAAVLLLGSGPFPILRQTVEELFDPKQPLEIQVAAVQALSASGSPDVADLLIDHWNTFSPRVRSAALEAIFARTNRLPALLEAIEKGEVSAKSLDAFERLQLTENSDPAIRARAARLFADISSAGNSALFKRYQAALAAPRDVEQGEIVFRRICAKCHRLGDIGVQIGSDLSAAQNRPDDAFLLEILEPNAKIAAGYRTYVIVDTSGRIFTGVLASESATSVTLRSASSGFAAADATDNAVIEKTILRKDIEEMRASEHSLMPDDLAKDLTPRDVANVIAFLRKALGPVPPSRRVLFDEQPHFATALHEGPGTATVVSDDVFSGKLALRITPPQRYSRTIPGWAFRIRENPGPGEYRYLRFAWKAEGSGVLIELADDGRWPPAEKPLRRYYSGKNGTPWHAVEISPTPPAQWTIVTRDLWKDFGDFTLTGIAPTAIDGAAFFDHIELLRSLDTAAP